RATITSGSVVELILSSDGEAKGSSRRSGSGSRHHEVCGSSGADGDGAGSSSDRTGDGIGSGEGLAAESLEGGGERAGAGGGGAPRGQPGGATVPLAAR